MMESSTVMSLPPQRPQHRRNASSKSNILRAFVLPKSRPASPEPTRNRSDTRTTSVPSLCSDYSHVGKVKVLGELQGNVQSPPSSPSKNKGRSVVSPQAHEGKSTTMIPTKRHDGSCSPKKMKSSTNLGAMFARRNRSSKDLTANVQKDKENTTPPSSSNGIVETPIWAQFVSAAKPSSRPTTRNGKSSHDLAQEIAKYTPQDYSPSKQRNFNGTLEQPGLRPTLNSRPHSTYNLASDGLAALGRRVSGARASLESRRSEDAGRRLSKERGRRVSVDRSFLSRRQSDDYRKASGSSIEQPPTKEKLNVVKRGGKVMAAVAALQGKSREPLINSEPDLDAKAIDEAFEAVLDSRNIPEPQRQKMRSLTLRVKQDFVRQDQGLKNTGSSPPGTVACSVDARNVVSDSPVEQQADDDSKATKRSRTRSRTFTFSKGDKRSGSTSPAKKQRSQSKSRPNSVQIPKEPPTKSPGVSATSTSPFGSFGRKTATQAIPADYISYLKKNQDPTKIEVGRLHKLRILLRNETVAWVDSFVSLGGMAEIIGLLHRTMAVEWREEHEDQLLHETLLCLKGLCTTECAMSELEKVADVLFPGLLGMLFDEEKKGPAEYTTRMVIVNVLFNFLSASLNSTAEDLEQRARRILKYLSEPQKSEHEQTVTFVRDMHTPRPYRLWCREVTNVTKEVFWIFLHHFNVVPLPKIDTSSSTDRPYTSETERSRDLEKTYTRRHFPGSRPPVPAAPYIGGVEWDATTYLTAHLDLLNGLISSLPTKTARNSLRASLRASGFERTLGTTLRTCKEKFYTGVHDALRAWVAAAAEDEWETRFVREGPTQEERAERAMKKGSPRKSPKKEDAAPKIEILPKIELNLEGNGRDAGVAEGWL